MCQQRGISILSILLGTCMALSVASAESSKPEYTKPSTEYEGISSVLHNDIDKSSRSKHCLDESKGKEGCVQLAASTSDDKVPGEVVKEAEADVDAPIQLVRPNPNGHEQLEVVEEGLKHLASVPSPLALIAVVGKFHTGKSFLLNQVMHKQTGFGVGKTVRPETMGIWMWGKPLVMTLDDGMNISVVFLDTEGFAASNISESYDAKVFAVASLLSSYLMYNSVKIIDQSDIDYLELLARRTQLFALQSQLNAEKYALEFNHNLLKFPPLLWVVQDFVQAGLGGSDDESAQSWLKRLMKTSTREQGKHEISLLDIFETVDCHTLFLPAVRKRLLEDLSRAKEEDLTDEYRAERGDLIEKLRKGLVAKERNGVAVDGAELSSLVKLLVEAANQGSLAEIPGRWGAFTQHLTQTAYMECLRFFDAEAEKQKDGAMGQLVLKSCTTEFVFAYHFNGVFRGVGLHAGDEKWYDETSNRTLRLMDRLLVGLGSSYMQSSSKIKEALARRYDTIAELNARRLEILCQQTQQTVEVDMDLEARKLVLPMGSQKLHSELDDLVTKHMDIFIQALSAINDTSTFLLYNSSTQKVLTGCTEKFLTKNRHFLEAMLESAKTEAIAVYSGGMSRELAHPLSTTRLHSLQITEAERAKEQYSAATTVAQPERFYAVHKSAFLLALKTSMEEDVDANNEQVRSLCNTKVEALLETLQDRFNSRQIPLPTNESALQCQYDDNMAILVKQYTSLLEQYNDMESFHSSLEKFKFKSQDTLEKLLKENIDAYTREVEVPLETAVKIVMMSADSYDTVFTLQQYTNAVCLLHLDSGTAHSWSVHLKRQIVTNFISNHLTMQRELQKRRGLWGDLKGFAQWLVWFFFGDS